MLLLSCGSSPPYRSERTRAGKLARAPERAEISPRSARVVEALAASAATLACWAGARLRGSGAGGGCTGSGGSGTGNGSRCAPCGGRRPASRGASSRCAGSRGAGDGRSSGAVAAGDPGTVGAFLGALEGVGADALGVAYFVGHHGADPRRARLGLHEVTEAEMDGEGEHDPGEDEDQLLRFPKGREERRWSGRCLGKHQPRPGAGQCTLGAGPMAFHGTWERAQLSTGGQDVWFYIRVKAGSAVRRSNSMTGQAYLKKRDLT
jgi:hypothetical protein